jgi:hypothetical protein
MVHRRFLCFLGNPVKVGEILWFPQPQGLSANRNLKPIRFAAGIFKPDIDFDSCLRLTRKETDYVDSILPRGSRVPDGQRRSLRHWNRGRAYDASIGRA